MPPATVWATATGQAPLLDGASAPERAARFRAAVDMYCLKFEQIELAYVASTLKEMEQTGTPVVAFFLPPQCQPRSYSDEVHSPIAHVLIDDPTARLPFFYRIYRYYEKRNETATFATIVNAENTRGETVLDYIQWINANHLRSNADQQEALNTIIRYVCSKGGTYHANKEMSCPAPR